MTLSLETRSTSLIAAQIFAPFPAGGQHSAKPETFGKPENPAPPNPLKAAAAKAEKDQAVIIALEKVLDALRESNSLNKQGDNYRALGDRQHAPRGPGSFASSDQIKGPPPFPGVGAPEIDFEISAISVSSTKIEGGGGLTAEIAEIQSYSITPDGISFSQIAHSDFTYDSGNGARLSYESQRAINAYVGR